MDKLEQLKKELETSDIMFSYNGIDYTICPWTEGSISACTAGQDDNRDFTSVDDLLDNWLLEGKPFKEIVNDITLL